MSKDPEIIVGKGDETLPVTEVLTGRGFITGKSGSGKSNTASVIAEQLLGQGFPLLIVDTDGEYWGLKEQYEILHVGADEECDLQVGPEHAEKIAELTLEQGVPIILDVSAYLDEGMANDLIRETARHLFSKEKKLKRPFLMLVEEVHEYIPETAGLDATGQMLIKVAKRGRKHGLGIAGISQRPADVKKDFITQANWLVWHRLTWDNDTKVVRRVLGETELEGQEVEDLEDGESFFVADWKEAPRLLRWRRKETFDAGATPGLEDYDRPDLKSVSGNLVSELEDITEREERRQDKIAQLEKKLDERDERIANLEEELGRAQDLSDMAQQFTEALAASGGDSEAMQEQLDEIREQKNEKIRETRKSLEIKEKELQECYGRIEELQAKAAKAKDAQRLQKHMEDIEEAARRLAEIANIELGGDERLRERLKKAQKRIEQLKVQNSSEEPLQSLSSFLEHEDTQRAIQRAKDAETEKQVTRILTALVEDEGGPVTIEQVCTRVGIKPSGGNLSRLRSAAEALGQFDLAEVSGSGKATEITLNQDLGAVQDRIGRAATRDKLKDIL